MARQYTTSLRCPSAASEHPVTVGSAAKQASISLPSCVGSPSKPSLGTSPSNSDGRCRVVAGLRPQPKVVVDRVKRRVHVLSVGAESWRVSVELRHQRFPHPENRNRPPVFPHGHPKNGRKPGQFRGPEDPE